MIPGIDVSHYQGKINWRLVKEAGIQFAFIKATEGIKFKDPYYDRNLVGAQEAGILVGAYCFLRADSDPEVQANHFLDTIGRTDEIMCALDVESTGTSFPTISQVYKWTHIFRQRTNNHPLVIYTGRWYWVGRMGNPEGVRLGPLWHSSYTKDPGKLYGGWDRFTFWQFTSSGQCAGIRERVDLNWFYGGRAALSALTTNGPVKDEDERTPEMMTIQSQDTGAVLHLSGGVTFLVENTKVLQDMNKQDIPHIVVPHSQFKRYEAVRMDDNEPNPI